MKPNPKAIKALKRVMTKEQRKEFVANRITQNGRDFESKCDYDTDINSPSLNSLRSAYIGFYWHQLWAKQHGYSETRI